MQNKRKKEKNAPKLFEYEMSLLNQRCSKNKLKVNAQPLKKGSTVTGYSGGGGGFGKPLLRDPKKVLTDVMNRYVSINNAKNLYGVIINKNLSLNINATKKLRKKMSK